MFIISSPPKNDFYIIILFYFIFLFNKMHVNGTYTLSCFDLAYFEILESLSCFIK
jgi:hypothetical protein